jgi:hypothetical protein
MIKMLYPNTISEFGRGRDIFPRKKRRRGLTPLQAGVAGLSAGTGVTGISQVIQDRARYKQIGQVRNVIAEQAGKGMTRQVSSKLLGML